MDPAPCFLLRAGLGANRGCLSRRPAHLASVWGALGPVWSRFPVAEPVYRMCRVIEKVMTFSPIWHVLAFFVLFHCLCCFLMLFAGVDHLIVVAAPRSSTFPCLTGVAGPLYRSSRAALHFWV